MHRLLPLLVIFLTRVAVASDPPDVRETVQKGLAFLAEEAVAWETRVKKRQALKGRHKTTTPICTIHRWNANGLKARQNVAPRSVSPFQGLDGIYLCPPRALPWAVLCQPFRLVLVFIQLGVLD